jgi:hypothetical protein
VVLLYLGIQKHATVLPYHPQKLNTMLVLKQPTKWFIKSILDTLGEKDKLHLPMLLCMDNTGAIYLSNIQAVG